MNKKEIASNLHKKVRYKGHEYYLICYQLCRDDYKAFHQLVLRDINADSEVVCKLDDVELVHDSRRYSVKEIFKKSPKQQAQQPHV